jgi:hypothetical protein
VLEIFLSGLKMMLTRLDANVYVCTEK